MASKITVDNLVVTNLTTSDGLNGQVINPTSGRANLLIAGWEFLVNNSTVYPVGKTKAHFVYTGANQTWTVPSGVSRIFVKMWGAGGGGGSYGGWRQGSLGGGGGYSQGLLTCSPGESITIRVGGGGIPTPGATKAWPDGGGASLSGGDNQYCANGGAGTSLLIPSISADYCMYAGGGGGGGAVNGFAVNSGGAGGGITGQIGCKTSYTQSSGINYGGGGTQTAGGTAGTGNQTTGQAGSLYQGGTHQNANCYGGGGGGGYYGGGAGAYGGSSMGGGGGGSGYIRPGTLFGFTATGSSRNPALSWDNDLNAFTTQVAFGGEESGFGGDGLVVIYY